MQYGQRLCFSLCKHVYIYFGFWLEMKMQVQTKRAIAHQDQFEICHDLAKSGCAFRAEYPQYEFPETR